MKYSVVTICYNAEQEIEETILSILNQTRTDDVEYIVVDGASKDRTFSLVQSYREHFQAKGIPFRCYSEPDKGISDAFNKGVLYAEGEWIALVNAGDCYAPDALESFERAGVDDVDICYGNVLWSDAENGRSYIRKSSPFPSHLKLGMPILHPACIIRKSAYQDVGLYRIDYRYSMDRELLARMWMAGKRFKYIDHVFSVMRAGGLSDTNAYTAPRKKESMNIALACGVSRCRFEWSYGRAKYKYFLSRWVKQHRFIFRLYTKMFQR